jgi:hypothetical protein
MKLKILFFITPPVGRMFGFTVIKLLRLKKHALNKKPPIVLIIELISGYYLLIPIAELMSLSLHHSAFVFMLNQKYSFEIIFDYMPW